MKITIEVSDDTARHVNRMLELANAPANAKPDGDLTIASLAKMLIEDCALVVRRPGSWEGSNMAHVLSSHGYEI